MQIKYLFKKVVPHLISFLVILVFNLVLLYPELQGKKIVAGDIVSSEAQVNHILKYREGSDLVYWNSAQFSGGPISLLDLGRDHNFTTFIQKALSLYQFNGLGMFLALGYIMYFSLILLRINPWLSLAISLTYLANLHFVVLFEAGHNKKIRTLSYFPFIIAGMVSLFKNNFLRGFVGIVIGSSLAIYNGHVQMVYYLFIALIFFTIPFIVSNIQKGQVKGLVLAISIAIGGALLGTLSNYAQLLSSYNFSKSTMRGGSILEKSQGGNGTNAGGLEWDYAMRWSHSTPDLLATIIPRAVGGGSSELVDKNNPLGKLMRGNGAKVVNNKVRVPGYWSTMPFTSGPPYVGIVMFVLFIVAMFQLDREWVIAFISAIFIVLLLTMGENAAFLNRFLFDYFPLFNKFRAPNSSSNLWPAFLSIGTAIGIQNLLNSKDIDSKKILIGIGSVAGFLLIVSVLGSSLFSFLGPNDGNYPPNIQEILIEGRASLLKSDALRSLFLCLLTGGLIFALLKHKIGNQLFLGGIALLLIIDVFSVDKRYLTEDKFLPKSKYQAQFNPKPSDLEIQKREPNGRGYYRVLDLSVNTFNDSKPSYFHNQIGGYDAAKLQRYQDIIDYHISKNNLEVLNMLNAKYIVSKEGQVQVNANANGNAWFVETIKNVNSAKEEIEALNVINTKKEAVLNISDFSKVDPGNGQGQISLTKYEPDYLEYTVSNNSNQFAVFSEVWYGGAVKWKVWIDGEPADFVRVNYLLRGLEVPANAKKIVMEFKPKAKGAVISVIASILGLLSLLYMLWYMGMKFKNESFDKVPVIEEKKKKR